MPHSFRLTIFKLLENAFYFLIRVAIALAPLSPMPVLHSKDKFTRPCDRLSLWFNEKFWLTLTPESESVMREESFETPPGEELC